VLLSVANLRLKVLEALLSCNYKFLSAVETVVSLGSALFHDEYSITLAEHMCLVAVAIVKPASYVDRQRF